MQDPLYPDKLGRLKQVAEVTAREGIFVELNHASTRLPPRASKYGGMPFTPPGFVWPTNPEGKPMEFLGQVNVAEVTHQVPSAASALPSAGLVQFFCDVERIYEAEGPWEQSFWRLVWHPAPDQTPGVPTDKGIGFPEDEFAMSFRPMMTWPDLVALFPPLVRLDPGDFTDAEVDAYTELTTPRYGENHQILGHPLQVQIDPRYELLSEHIAGPSFNEHYQNNLDLMARLRVLMEWQLLWQIDSDDRLGYCWNDFGTMYILVRREALRAGDLSQPALSMQTT